MLDAGLCTEVRVTQLEVGDLEDCDSFGAHPFCESAFSRVKFYEQDPPCGIDAKGKNGRVPLAGSGGGECGAVTEAQKCEVAVWAKHGLGGPATFVLALAALCACARANRAFKTWTFSAAAFFRPWRSRFF